MAVVYTQDQLDTIEARGASLLVSAAAGSGKTAVLVERIIRLICDPERPKDIDRLLVVTFTNAAAAQMRERITQALNRAVEERPEDQHLIRQLTLIHNAQITTIDSFCLYLIRNYFDEIGLDPDFRVADEAEIKLLEREVLSDLLEDRFAAGEREFLDCVEYFVPSGSEKKLEELILGLYRFAMSYPWPKDWLKEHQRDYDVDASSMEAGSWVGILKEYASSMLSEAERMLEEAWQLSQAPDGPGMYEELLLCELQQLRALKQAVSGSLDDMYRAFSTAEFAPLSRKRGKNVDPEKKERAKELRNQAKDIVGKKLRDKYFKEAPQVLAARMAECAAPLSMLIGLAIAFCDRMAEKKRGKGLLDFNDMEHFALRILLDKEGETFRPTKTALMLREYYEEIMIDEYQDSNLVQEYLLWAICGEEEGRYNRFMVGDVKQSIYKFRLARPELFMEKLNRYRTGEGEKERRIDLKQNFRSRRQVTESVNLVFSRLMGRDMGGIEYDENAALYPAAVYPEPEEELTAQGREKGEPAEEQLARNAENCDAGNSPSATAAGEDGPEDVLPVSAGKESAAEVIQEREAGTADRYETELLLAVEGEDGLEKREREALVAADRIHAMVGSFPVRDRESGGLRPARYGDIVILLRAASGMDEVFKKVLSQSGIPVHITSRKGYFEATEVQTILNVLKILNNPMQDIPLFAVLKAPFSGFTDQDIAWIRAGRREGCLYDALRACAGMLPPEEEPPAPDAAACMKNPSAGSGQDGAEAVNTVTGGTDADGTNVSGTSGGTAAPDARAAAETEALRERCRSFLAWLNRYRGYVPYMPIRTLINRLLQETGYLDTVTALPGGAQRRANLLMLLNRAESYEKTSYTGLFHFIRYIGQEEKYDIDYGEASLLDENADTVRIMSIHKSKGLEFPICIVAGLSKQFNRSDARTSVIMDMDYGVAVDYVNTACRVKADTLKKNVLSGKLGRDALAEELRVLYVAMTRAEEKLILIGGLSQKNLEKLLTRLEKRQKDPAATVTEGLLPYSERTSAACYMDWLLPAWLACGRTPVLVEASDLVRGQVKEGIDRNHLQDRLRELMRSGGANGIQEPGADAQQALRTRMEEVYPHAGLSGLYAKTTVSELKRAGMEEAAEGATWLFEPKEVVPYLPAFARGETEEPGGTARGNAYHKVMELFPFASWLRHREGIRREAAGDAPDDIPDAGLLSSETGGDAENISSDTPHLTDAQYLERLLDQLVVSGRLGAEYRSAVRAFRIERFLKSPLAMRMMAADAAGRLHREQPFVLGLPANEMNPDFPAEETVLIQGIIDVWFPEEGGLVLADYKTDAVEYPEELVQRYSLQLAYYERALTQLTGLKVKEKLIYSFALGQEIRIDS